MKKNYYFSGFTLVELLVVIAVVAVLVSLLLSAVVQVRAAARKSICIDHHRQSALAVLQYTAANDDRLPIGRQNRTFDRHTSNRSHSTWRYLSLPFLEEQSTVDKLRRVDWTYKPTLDPLPEYPNDSILVVFQCPSADRYPHHVLITSVSPNNVGDFLQGRMQIVTRDANEAVIFHQMGGSDIRSIYGVRPGLSYGLSRPQHLSSVWTDQTGGRVASLRRVTDGLSKTALLGENTELGQIYPWLGADAGLQVFHEDYPRNEVHEFVSPHNTFHLAFCDGTVRSVSPNVNRNVLISFVTRAGGEPTGFAQHE